MHTYTAKTFTLPALDGISPKSVEEHLGLYQGYVKNWNAMTALIPELMKDNEKNVHAIAEIMRRRSFEFDGMRLHELYFAQFEGTPTGMDAGSVLAPALATQYGSMENLMTYLKQTTMMRGPGWAILYYDSEASQFHIGFSGEQHNGHYVTLPIILAVDVWEHAFLLDYGAQGKGKYIDAFMKNLNWGVMEKRFVECQE
jgi:Fe-Mn family superoxide dismutase